MTITQIKNFLVSAESGSLQKASEKLYITHQALSKQIKAIEKELEIELFDRSNKKSLRLTRAGEIMYSAWKESVSNHDKAISDVNRLRQEQKASFVVGIQNMTQIRLDSMNAFARYKLRFPSSELEYRFGTPEEMRFLLDTNQIDMAIMFSPSVEYPENYSFYIINDHRENPVIAVSVDNPLSRKQSLTLKDIEAETFIMISSAYSKDIVKKQYRDFIANHIDPETIKIKTVPDPNELVMALALNQGVALIHETIIEQVKDKIKTFPYRTADENAYIGTIIIWKNHRYDQAASAIRSFFLENGCDGP